MARSRRLVRQPDPPAVNRVPPTALPDTATPLNTGSLRFFFVVFDFDFQLFLQIENFFVPLRTRNVRETDYNKLN